MSGPSMSRSEHELVQRVTQMLREVPGDFRRAAIQVQVLVAGIGMMAALLLLMVLSALFSGLFGPALALLFVVFVLLGLSFLLLRKSGDADRALDAALHVTNDSALPAVPSPPSVVGMVAYQHDGWLYGVDGNLPNGVLVVDAHGVVFTGGSRRRAGALREALGGGALGAAVDLAASGLDGLSREFRFEFRRETIERVLAPRAAQDLVLVTSSGSHRFKVAAGSWVPSIEAFALHRYPLARANSPF